MARYLNSKRRKRLSIIIILLIVVIICVVVKLKQADIDKEYNEEKAKYEQLQRDIKDEEQRALVLKREQDYQKTDKYFEELARKVLGLVYEDELIFEPEE